MREYKYLGILRLFGDALSLEDVVRDRNAKGTRALNALPVGPFLRNDSIPLSVRAAAVLRGVVMACRR